MIDYKIMMTSSGGGLSPELRRRIKKNKRYNISILAVDAKETKQAKMFADNFSVVPNGEDKNYIEKITELKKLHNVNMIIPCSDEEALSLSKNRNKVEDKNCVLSCMNYETLKIISNKIETYKLLNENGIKIPQYFSINSLNELGQVVSSFLKQRSEVVVKPASGRGGRNVMVIGRKKRVKNNIFSEKQFMKSFISDYEDLLPVIVMEKLFEPIYDLDILANDGLLVRSVLRRRINPDVPNDGHIIERENFLYPLAKKLTKILNLSWLYDCDIMLTSEGTPMILEINPRPSGSVAVALSAGVDFFDDMIALHRGDKLSEKHIKNDKVVFPFTSLI